MNQALGEVEPDGFLTAVEVAGRLGALAGELPVRTASPVRSLRRSGKGLVLETPDRTVHTRSVVVASGGQNVPRIPSISNAFMDGLRHVHTGDYRSADQLPEGAVLVVGSAQSGCQIAEELALAGRQVYLCTSRVGRFPWSYRGRSCMSWLAAGGFFSQRREDLPDPAVAKMPVPTIASGGRSLSLQSLASPGRE